jgi:hypothetical protein
MHLLASHIGLFTKECERWGAKASLAQALGAGLAEPIAEESLLHCMYYS